MLLSALVFSSAGSFISAVTGNFTGLHLGRCIQGLGAGGLAAVSNLIITDLPSEGDGRIWSATAGATYVLHSSSKPTLTCCSWAIGAITGPIIGGVLAEKGQWRWMFWINLPFTLLALLVLLLTASFKTGFPSSKMPKFLWRVDWLGYIFFAGSLISVLLGITWVRPYYLCWKSCLSKSASCGEFVMIPECTALTLYCNREERSIPGPTSQRRFPSSSASSGPLFSWCGPISPLLMQLSIYPSSWTPQAWRLTLGPLCMGWL